jgi:hypothetical protein
MALTPVRWMMIAVASCAVIWIGLLRGMSPVDRPATQTQPAWFILRLGDTTISERRLANLVARTNERRRMLELRDSALANASASPKTSAAGLTVVVDPRFSPALRETLVSELEQQWAALGLTSRVPTLVALVTDTIRAPHGLPRQIRLAGGLPIETFTPSSATGGRCLSVAHIAAAPESDNPIVHLVLKNATTKETTQALLGACALINAFGAPGPYVERWMEDTHWQLARLPGWNTAAQPQPRVAQGNSANLVDGLSSTVDASWQLRRTIAPGGIACLAGKLGACERAFFEGRTDPSDTAWTAHVISSSGTSATGFFFPIGPSTLGPDDGTIVSEMVRTLGKDRFAKFWTSSEPVHDAFATAGGGDLDAFARSWAQRMYGTTTVGPTLSSLGLSTGTVVVLLTFGLAVMAERRRRVA